MSTKRKRPAGAGRRFGGAKSHNEQSNCSTKVSIYVGEVVVGYVAGDTFYKAVRSSMHFLRRPQAIAFDTSTLHDAEQAGAVRVEVLDRDTRTVYRARLADVWRHGFALNRGFGKQRALIIDRWGIDGRPPKIDDKPAPLQMSLFGGKG